MNTESHSDLTTTEIRRVFGDLAFDLAEHGTAGHEGELAELADAVRHVAPGAASALVDASGSEVARLRAFAAAHRAVNHALRPAERVSIALRLRAYSRFALIA